MKIQWHRCGRSIVGDVGRLQIVIHERGNLEKGHKWHVHSVFGVWGYGVGGPFDSFDKAREAAKKLAKSLIAEIRSLPG